MSVNLARKELLLEVHQHWLVHRIDRVETCFVRVFDIADKRGANFRDSGLNLLRVKKSPWRSFEELSREFREDILELRA